VNVFIKCIKVTLTYNENVLGNSTKFGAYKFWCSQWCTGHCPVPMPKHLTNWPLSSFLRATPLKFTRLSGAQPDCLVSQQSNGQVRPMVDCANCSAISRAEVRLQSQNASDCSVPQEDRILQRSIAPNPNGQLTWHVPDRTMQCPVHHWTV
jgi:hypothetical protein